MKNFVVAALSAAVGTLFYTRFFSDIHQFDWGRAIFVGLFAGVGASIFSVSWFKKRQKQ